MRYILTQLLFLVAIGYMPLLAQQSGAQKSQGAGELQRIDSLTQKHYRALNQSKSPELWQGNAKNNLEVQSATTWAETQRRMDLLHSEVPLEMNAQVASFIDLYGNRKQLTMANMLKKAEYFFPVFEEILAKHDLPLELKYLAIVESALNPEATSWAGAAGLWQFIHSTGVQFGLGINNYVDERREVIKSTEAACAYFRKSYEIYGDWLLVIASYNCGTGNVNKAIRNSGGRKNFWQIMPYLPKETRGYVPAFVAVAYVMNYPELFGISATQTFEHPICVPVTLNQNIALDALALALNTSVEELKLLNPHLKKDFIVAANNGVCVNMPYANAIKYAQLDEDLINMPLVDDDGTVYRMELVSKKLRHKVKKGETLTSVARKYGLTPNDIKEWNIIRKNRLIPSSYITVYIEQEQKVVITDEALLAKLKVVQPKRLVYHEVIEGDTLYNIAKKYKVTNIQQIRQKNKLAEGENIKPGSILIIESGT